MRTLAYLPAILLVAPICTATAQDRTPPLEPGQRVRVTAPSVGTHNVVATIVALHTDTLVFRTEGSEASVERIPITAVRQLEIYHARKSKVLLATGVGLLAGAATGAIVGYASGEDPPGTFMRATAEQKAAIGAVVFGGAGAIIGYIVGHFIGGDRWEEVPLDRRRVSLVPQRDGRLVLAVSVAF